MVRKILTPDAALDIYASRHLRTSKVLAALYGVSHKTVRDVCSGRTWGAVTGARAPRPVGRPRRRAFSLTTDDPFLADFQRYRDLIAKLVRAHDARLCAISRTHLTSLEHLRENSQRVPGLLNEATAVSKICDLSLILAGPIHFFNIIYFSDIIISYF